MCERERWSINNGSSGGYFKFLRGHNIGGIEAQAVYIDPDFSRGLLAEGRKRSSIFEPLISYLRFFFVSEIKNLPQLKSINHQSRNDDSLSVEATVYRNVSAHRYDDGPIMLN